MKKCIYSLACLILLVYLTSDLYGFDSKDFSSTPGPPGLNIFQTGRAIMVGETLTNPLKWKEYTSQDFGIDMGKINPRITDNKVINDLAKTTAKMEFKLAGGAAANGVTVYNVIDTGKKLYDAYKVGTGRASPEILRGTVPHMVMAWETLRGPENNKWYKTTENFNNTFVDGNWKIHQMGSKVTEKITTSTAPGYIGKYGYDPNTDTGMSRTRMNYTERILIGGNGLNQNYSPPTTFRMPSYTPPIQTYSPPPSFHMPSFSPSFGGRR